MVAMRGGAELQTYVDILVPHQATLTLAQVRLIPPSSSLLIPPHPPSG